MSAHIVRYGAWQLRDYLKNRGFPTIVVAVMGAYLTLVPILANFRKQMQILPPKLIERYGGMDGARATLMRDANEMFLVAYLGIFVYLCALFAMNGVISDDRKKGYYRFLFSKPVSPSRFYGQLFLVHLVGFLIVACALGLLHGALVAPVLTLQLVSVVALMFIMYAGVGFALSAAARWDWLTLVAATVFANFMWLTFGQSTSVFAWLLYLLPPLHRTSEIYEAVAKHAPVNGGLLSWFAGYGIVCFVIGLVVLRYRRLAIV
ncbi:MAG: hypothetical protein ABI664_16650 [bacterium]